MDISRGLGENDRVILLIDGLDEGSDAANLLESLPKSAPDKILIVYASREHPRVRQRVYLSVDRERRQELALGGLSEGDARAILSDYVSKYELRADYLKEVAQRSAGNPLYLKLLAQGLSRGDFELNNSGILPSGIKDIYKQSVNRIASEPCALEFLRLIVVAKDFVTASMANSVLELPDAEDSAGTRLIPACMELLIENVLTEKVDDYQLFHESLRDYLRQRYPGECRKLEYRLYRWCLNWPNLRDESCSYALRHLAAHARALLNDRQAIQPDAMSAELDTLFNLVESPRFVDATFDILGEGSAYQELCRLVLGFLNYLPPDNLKITRGAALLCRHHIVPQEHYLELLRQIDSGTYRLDRLNLLATAGPTPRDRVLLALRGLAIIPIGVPIPAGLRKRLNDWCDQAGSEALKRLCRGYFARASTT